MSYQGGPPYGNGYPQSYVHQQYGMPVQQQQLPAQQSQLPPYRHTQANMPAPLYTERRGDMEQIRGMQVHNQAMFYQHGQQQYHVPHNQFIQTPQPPLQRPPQRPMYHQSAQPPHYNPAYVQSDQYHTQYAQPQQLLYQNGLHIQQPQSYLPQYDGATESKIDQSITRPVPGQPTLPSNMGANSSRQTPSAVPQQPQQPQVQRAQVQNGSQQPRPSQPPAPDPISLLPGLAEEYFSAAHGMSLRIAKTLTGADMELYQKLIATGLACLQSALEAGKLAPKLEAKVRLRYAAVLVEETENVMEAEECLNKGILICQQNRLYELRYSMQVLSARLLYSKSRKAAFKSLEGYIADTEVFQHHSWTYVFRLMRATLLLRSSQPTDTHAALQDLKMICDLAQERGDYAVLTTTSLMEALAYLHMPGPEAQANVDRALAIARTYQFQPDCTILPLQSLTHVVDVTASLLYTAPKKMMPKVKELQLLMNKAAEDDWGWPKNNTILQLPVKRSHDAQISHSPISGLVINGNEAIDILQLSFPAKWNCNTMTFLLAGIALLQVNAKDSRKTLLNGLRHAGELKHMQSSGPLPDALETVRWMQKASCYFHIYLALNATALTDWTLARHHLDGLEKQEEVLNEHAPKLLSVLRTYLWGMYYQGIGEFDRALKQYNSDLLSTDKLGHNTYSAAETVHRDLSILASMNALAILELQTSHDAISSTSVLDKIAPFCLHHQNRSMRSAYHILKASLSQSPPPTQKETKDHIRTALEEAQFNSSLMQISIVLSLMCNSYFDGIVGEQAEKCARSADMQAKRSGNLLWMSVGNGLLAKTYQIEGKKDQAAQCFAEGLQYAEKALETPSV
jgi:tetratricopeptide (TPR) repeat protein